MYLYIQRRKYFWTDALDILRKVLLSLTKSWVPLLAFYWPDSILTVQWGGGAAEDFRWKGCLGLAHFLVMTQSKVCVWGASPACQRKLVFPLAYTHVTFLLQFFRPSISSFCAPIFSSWLSLCLLLSERAGRGSLSLYGLVACLVTMGPPPILATRAPSLPGSRGGISQRSCW